MSGKRFVYLTIEIGSRDFDPRLLLALHLQKKGYVVVLIDDKILTHILQQIPASILFDKAFTNIIYSGRLSKAKDNGWIITGIDEEGFLSKDDKRILGRFSEKAASIIDCAFFWSKEHQDAVSEFSECKKWSQNGYSIGSPRLDLLSQNGLNYYRKIYGQISNLYGEYLLINTNFTSNSKRSREELLRIAEQAGALKSLGDKKALIDLIKYDGETFKEFMIKLKNIAANTNSNIIIRPHPSEKKKTYCEIFSEYDNINILRYGPAEPWIHNARTVYGHHCTTLSQAYVACKEVYNFTPKNCKPNHQHFKGRPSEFMEDYQQENSEKNKQFLEEKINRMWKFSKNGITNAEKISIIIDKVAAESPNLKLYRAIDLYSMLNKLNLKDYINPKVEANTFCNCIEKVKAMNDCFQIGCNIKSMSSIEKVALILE